MMSRYQFDQERTLSELSEFGIGFSEGKPRPVKISTFEWVTRWLTGTAVASAFVVALAIVFFWARYAA